MERVRAKISDLILDTSAGAVNEVPLACVVCGKPAPKLANGYGYRKTCSRTCLKNLQSETAHKISNNGGISAGLPILTHKSIACKRPPMTEKTMKELL